MQAMQGGRARHDAIPGLRPSLTEPALLAGGQFETILDIPSTAMYDASMNLSKDLVAASASPLVLSLLDDGESYGYAIIQRVRELTDGEIEWTDGMLYPVLHR